MSVAFVDTSAWYALLDQRDPHHPRAKAFAEAFSGSLVTSNYVALETTNLILMRKGFSAAMDFLRMTMESRLLEVLHVTPEQHTGTLELFSTLGKQGLSLTDCSSVLLMRETKLSETFCFDEDFASQGFTCLPSSPA
ncbi:MAG: PIN domain-containing protein [Elusimicrobia bacterium]|nr:PIN domain-containing protein [Elusimicrobiota bacterium]